MTPILNSPYACLKSFLLKKINEAGRRFFSLGHVNEAVLGLIKNPSSKQPRVLYLWSARGGGVSAGIPIYSRNRPFFGLF